MKVFRPLRLILLALLLSVIPVSSYAGVFISVSFAPPILPVYEQPPCPDEGLMWVPGYWAYGEDGYYWIPGTWVPAPYEGALWTPPYWGWESNFYIFHPGYWGRHVGYYGGVNYGFGYMGIGFVGGMWRGHDFEYNRAVMRVDERRIHNTYEDRTIVNRYTIPNDRRVAFSGGRDGIHHDPRPEERIADRDQHVRETSFQQTHETAARSDRSLYVKNNGGHPSSGAVQRPFGGGGNPQGGQQFNRDVPQRTTNQGAGANPGRNTYTPPNGNNGGNRQFDNPRNSNNGNPGGGFNGNPRTNNPPPEYRNVNPPSNNSGRQGGFTGNPRNDNPQPDNRNFNNRGNQGNPQPQHPQPEFRQMPQQREAPPAPRPQPQMQQRPQPPPQQQQPRGNPQPQQQRGGEQHGGDQRGHEDHQH